jgi:hypothetical protein
VCVCLCELYRTFSVVINVLTSDISRFIMFVELYVFICVDSDTEKIFVLYLVFFLDTVEWMQITGLYHCHAAFNRF